MIAEILLALQALFASDALLALVLCGLTVLLVAFCVPGTIVPLSLSSGALLGLLGGAAVFAGAVIGSHLLFLASRHLLSARIHARWGARISPLADHFEKRGFLYIAGLRVAGIPHFLVTAGSALSPVRARSFLAATAIGFLPAILLGSTAGSLF
ncbi:VTT domain-containing protein [Tsuneonella sp. HG222]